MQKTNLEKPIQNVHRAYEIQCTNEDKLEKIKSYAQSNNWEYIGKQTTPPMLSFKKKGMRINIYYTQMTVVTALDHPQAGKRQLVRRRVSMTLLNKIFMNPRIHTGRGYYEKPTQYESNHPL